MARREHPRYENMEWPDWEFREYPMMVYPGAKDIRVPEYHKDGKLAGKLVHPGVIVQHDGELEKVLAGEIELNESGTGLITDEDVRGGLIQELTRLGVQFDRRWGIEKLQNALDDASVKEEIT